MISNEKSITLYEETFRDSNAYYIACLHYGKFPTRQRLTVTYFQTWQTHQQLELHVASRNSISKPRIFSPDNFEVSAKYTHISHPVKVNLLYESSDALKTKRLRNWPVQKATQLRKKWS